MSEQHPFAGQLRATHAENNAGPSRLNPAHRHAGSGRLWLIPRAACLALMIVVVVPFAAAVPLRWRQLSGAAEATSILGLPLAMESGYTSRLGPGEVEALQSLGLSLGFYATYLLSFEVALALVCVLVGLFIFWRSAEGWLTLWTATVVVLLGVGSVSPELPTLSPLWPGWWWLFVGVGMLGMVSNLYLLFLAPDGRFVPPWTWPLAAGFTGLMLALALFTFTVALSWGRLGGMVGIFIAAPAWFVLLGLGSLCQVYRYRHVSSPIQRQQIKWVAVGLAAVTIGMVLNAALLTTCGTFNGLERAGCNLARATVVNLCLMALPLCLAFSILRYRLWDIDVIIRRTLIYSVLSGVLAFLYFGSVLLLQNVFRLLTGQEQNSLVVVLSTLASAVMVVPLRRRVQAVIDRRFFRRKYDAARILAEFGTSARDVVDLDDLTERLVNVVDATMQPASVALWLKSVERSKRI